MYFGTTFMQLKCPADYKAPTVKKEPRGVSLPTITDRQSAIINGSAAKVRKNEVTVLLDKLTRLELENEAEELRNRYLQFFEYIPEEPSRYSMTEAAGLLQSLTPWNMPIPKQEVNLVNDNKFCNRLKSAMEARDMTQTALSKAAGISIGNISKYLAGTMQPRADKIKLLSEALNVESLWLMGEKENPGCFDNADNTFIDPYMKSGMFVTEIVKRLFNSEALKEKYPDRVERLQHIFAEQVYGLAPTEIIYQIATHYIFGFADKETLDISRKNFRCFDTLPPAQAGKMREELEEEFSKQ